MSIWFAEPSLKEIMERNKGTMMEHTGIEMLEIGPDYLMGKMPVDHRTFQPDGILHGGASVVLAETLGSIAANLCIDRRLKKCVGLEINANHLRPVSKGFVCGNARPVHIGKTTQVWEIRIVSHQDHLVCIARITMAVLTRENQRG
jgi:1,4-dihydroxy-2-naphthoyl-CoA hydrolase